MSRKQRTTKSKRKFSKAPNSEGATVTDLSATEQVSMSSAISQAYADAWTGDMFAPGAPVMPRYSDGEKPRVFDYAAGVNLYMTPRSGYGLIPFPTLRTFADMCDAVRIVIEAIKREIRALEWDIQPLNSKDDTDYSTDIGALRAFWSAPDGFTEFDAWCNSVLEDVLVVDALSLWENVDEEGQIKSIEQIDGATIRPLLDKRGKIPAPPVPAYMQAIKGQNWQWFTVDQMVYRPFNTSPTSPYGKSPTEFLILRINEYLRRQQSNAAYWDQTNVPEALVGLPKEMQVEAIKTFQEYFDALLTGDINKLRRLKFIPVAGASMPVYEFRRPDVTSVFDEWMLKMTCWAFGFLPSELGLVSGSGLGGKGFMEGQENAQYRFGLGPLIQYIQNVITGIIKKQTSAPLGFRFINIGPEEDQQIEGQVLQTQLQNGVIDINVWRKKVGQEPIEGAKPFMVINGVPILLDDLFAPKPATTTPVVSTEKTPATGLAPATESEPAPAKVQTSDEAVIKLALSEWREKVKRRLSDNKVAGCDPPQLVKALLPTDLVGSIKRQLTTAEGDPLEVFTPFLAKAGGPRHATTQRDEIEARLNQSLSDILDELSGEYEDPRSLVNAEDDYWVAFYERVGKALTPGLVNATLVGVSEVPRITSMSAVVDWSIVNDSAAQWARDYAASLVTKLRENTVKSVRDAVADWIEQGGALKDLRNSINGIINDKPRAQLIAQTESTRAFAEGNTVAWKAQGVEARKWFTARDEAVCPICGKNKKTGDPGLEGVVARIGEPFVHPTTKKTYANPPAHPGCRCYLQPVVVEK